MKISKICQDAFQRLMNAVEAGKSEQIIEYLKAMAQFHNYSFINTILICLQRPDATYVAGFGTWKKLGRYVKKGEQGIAIMAPVVYHRKINPTGAEDEQLNKLLGHEEIRSFKVVHVFDASQTDGKPLPEPAAVKGNPGLYIERLKEYIRNKGIVIDYSNRIGLAEGYSTGGKIVLRESLEKAKEFSVMVHELAHEMLHKKESAFSKDKKIVETEAEAVAFVVCHGIGLNVNTASSDYIQLYNGDRKTLQASFEMIQSTASEILKTILHEDNIKQKTECFVQAA